MKTHTMIALTLSTLIFTPLSLAQDESESSQKCNLIITPPKQVLKSLYDKSLAFAINTCKAMYEDDVRAVKDMGFLTGGIIEGARQEVLNFYTTSFPESIFPTVKSAKFMWAEYQFPQTLSMDSYELTLAYSLGRKFRFSGPKSSYLPIFNNTDHTKAHCLSLGYSSCKSFF